MSPYVSIAACPRGRRAKEGAMAQRGGQAAIAEGPGEWLTLVEASRSLGCSIDTVRRRARDGAYRSRKEHTRYGEAWRVWIQAGTSPPRPSADGKAELLALVDRLTQQMVEMARRVGALEAQLTAGLDRRAE